MHNWMPVRKIGAAIIAALAAAPAVIAFVPTEWQPVIAAAVPVIVGYLTPSRPSDDDIPGGETGDL